MRPLAATLAAAACVSCSVPSHRASEAPRQAPGVVRQAVDGPRTRAERSGFRETSSYADVIAFLDSLKAAGAQIHVTSMGRTVEGREIPVVIASRPLVTTPEGARRLARPIVYLQANIHAGEVEGKEALQALLRDLTLGSAPNVLDSLVIIGVPIYNADGNEKLGPQSTNRSEQNGPAVVGVRANAAGLDLNRDYIKADAPETRAALALLSAWQPDVFVDMHTTNGSYHGYGLTYSPSLNPAAVHGGGYARDVLLPELRRRTAERGLKTFDYGNFSLRYGADVNTDTVKQAWWTYDHRPRFGTNYYGLRHRIAVLAEAYSHDPFERRVESMYIFVSELLSLVAERAADVRSLPPASASARTPIRSRLTTTPFIGEVIAEDLARTGDSSVTEPGVPPGLRRTGRFRALQIPIHDRFEPTLLVNPPQAYAIDIAQTDLIPRLRAHGIEVHRLSREWTPRVEIFEIDSAIVATTPFQRHREQRLVGRWAPSSRTFAAGTWIVPVDQPLGTLVTYMLEPESDDGLATWNLVAPQPEAGGRFPVVRVSDALDDAPRTRWR